MALIIPPGYMQVSYRWQALGDANPYISTIGVDHDGAPQTVLNTIVTSYIGLWPAGDTFTQFTFLGCIAQVGQDGGPPVTIEANAAVVGTFSGAPLPSNCAILIRKSTALGGRRGRGRMYWPSVIFSEANADHNGMLAAGVISAYNTKLNTHRSVANFVLLHHDATIPTPITALTCQPQLATQRRRMRG